MIGTRVFPNGYGQLRLPDGGYAKDLRGRWWVRPPGCNMIGLKPFAFTIVEHPDSTISVSEVINTDGHWRLDKGIWEDLDREGS